MIRPHASDRLMPLYVEDERERAHVSAEAETLPSLLLNSAAAANAVMLGAGYFSPLPGFMNVTDALGVAERMRTGDGLFWPIPCLNLSTDVSPIRGARRVALRDPNMEGNPVIAVQDVESIESLNDEQVDLVVEKVFRTLDRDHPGVSTFLGLGRCVIAGPIRVLNYSYFERDFPGTFRTAVQIRSEIAQRGWNRVVAFQTRNPMHRAHEELCKMAQRQVGADGVLIHMLLGKLKPGDIPAEVRDAAIRRMVELYFPPNNVMVCGYGFDMLYAGPREAVLHAVFRQNAGCSHLIVGRDHAGVGNYYGPFDAQTIFEQEVPRGALEIEIFKADHTAYSRKLHRVVMMRDAPDHGLEDFVLLSGTRVREMLAAGKPLPVEFARPEVAEILMSYYRQEARAGS
ncbi:MAG: sulfate adenylyltransferase [Gammaproteobacteria bacterium]|nr:sulfate adenylyltransferase [Gammaproteobacteria bacterium]